MYRKNADLMQFGQDVDSLSRNEVNGLEEKLNEIYHEYQNPTALFALLKKDGLYNTELLEQKLAIVRERKQYFDEQFKLQDQIVSNEVYVDYTKKSLKTEGGAFGAVSLALFGLYELIPGGSALLGLSIMAAIFGTVTVTVYSFSNKKTKAKLKELKEIQNSEKLLKSETTETKQLPYPGVKV